MKITLVGVSGVILVHSEGILKDLLNILCAGTHVLSTISKKHTTNAFVLKSTQLV